MVPIRKGDGTGLGAKGFSQIRKGDGTVLWNAIPDSVILQPEPNDLDSANGDTGQFSITSDPPQYKTDNRFDLDEDANIRVWWPQGTLDNDPKQGFELSAIMTTDININTGDPVFLFGVQDYDNFYAVGLYNDELSIYKDGLTSDDLESTTSLPSGFVFDDGHEYTADWGSDTITAKVYEIDQNDGERLSDNPLVTTSLNDSEYSDGGAGVGRGSGSDRVYLEHYVNRQPLD